MATTTDRTAPAEAQPLPSPSSLTYGVLNDRLLSLISHFRLVAERLHQAHGPYAAASDVLHDTTEALDRFHEDLEAWYEEHVKAPADGVLQACREKNLELIESLARRIAAAEHQPEEPQP